MVKVFKNRFPRLHVMYSLHTNLHKTSGSYQGLLGPKRTSRASSYTCRTANEALAHAFPLGGGRSEGSRSLQKFCQNQKMKRRKRKYATDRASPKNGAQEPRPTPVASGLGLPCPGRARLKKLAPIRIRNIALTERWRKLANVLVLVVNVFLQETRSWEFASAIGDKKANLCRSTGTRFRRLFVANTVEQHSPNGD
ncbi:unnamed protein product [Arctia plantaginis]|uniref:Uncharacterized protein n=1 Tax=Arctia plantaginis TaxID=874455 RepID=A0A8S0ZUE5_ARCPL|nr:unnamed protein product [Arctia plantaginis]